MRKFVHKLMFVVVSVLLIASLTGCSKFDASGYIKAVLDNNYYNDTTGILELGIATEEEAAATYNKGVESLVDLTFSAVTVPVSEEMKEEYRQFYRDLFANAKYTVMEASESDDGNFVVSIVCEKLNVFADANTAYVTELQTLVATWTEAALAGEEVPSDEAKFEQFFAVYKDCLRAELEEASYSEPVTVTVRVELVNNTWTINEEDRLNLEYSLIDFEEMYKTE